MTKTPHEARTVQAAPPLELSVQRYVDVEDASVHDVLRLAQEHGVRMVDLKFTDLPGTWQHFGISINELGPEAFEEGLGFDGSSIRGFQAINESDMLLVPDPSTAVIDPFYELPTLSLVCSVRDPITGEAYSRDPRYVAQKAERYLRASGVADTCFMGPEAEFYVFDHVSFAQHANRAFYEVESEEGYWTTGHSFGQGANGTRPNLGYKNRSQEGYFPAPPLDTFGDLRAEMVATLEQMGIAVEVHHHEVGGSGQAEIDLKFQPLLRMADVLQLHKYVVKNVAHRVGKSATFMPKPIFEENGSGMHVHQSLWKDGETIMFAEGTYGLISDEARHYVGGLLEHASALLAFCAPTTNSYKRLVPGYEAPVSLLYSQRNRSAAVRIPVYSKSPKSKRIEFRSPDPTANPYLAFSALLMAGLDGIVRGLEPPDPVDEDLYELPPERRREIRQVPGSLDGALDALEADHGFLLQGDVFTPDVIATYIELKREQADEIRLRPHPYEFTLFYDG
jgi:glutamine synthetase